MRYANFTVARSKHEIKLYRLIATSIDFRERLLSFYVAYTIGVQTFRSEDLRQWKYKKIYLVNHVLSSMIRIT